MPPIVRSGILGGMLPPGIGFDITMRPSPGILVRDFATLGAEIRSFKVPLHRSVRDVMTKSIRENFDVGGRPPWEPLSDLTQKQRRLQGYGSDDILIRSGKLRQVASQINIWTINRDEAFIADLPSTVWYGKVHQGGGGIVDIFGSSIPARPWAVIQDKDMDDIEEIFFIWIEERLAANGFVPGI